VSSTATRVLRRG